MAGLLSWSSVLKSEAGTAMFIPYGSHVTKSCIRLHSGEYIQTFRLQGAAHESADIEDINSWHDQLNNLMRNIQSPNLALWSHVVRRRFDEFPGGKFQPGFAHDFNEKYRQHIGQSSMLINELYLTFVFTPEALLAKTAGLMKTVQKSSASEVAHNMERDLELFDDEMSKAYVALDRYEPELLGCYEHRGNMFSEVLEFLAYLCDGEWRRFPLPRADISNVLVTTRPYFGKGGTITFKTPSKIYYGGLLSIQEYPASTSPGILNELLGLPFELVVSQSFVFLSKNTAVSRMRLQQRRMQASKDLAQSQVQEIDNALDDLISNRFVMGGHSLSVFIKADDPRALNRHMGAASSVISESGMKSAREDLGMVAAFWAQLPGNFAYRVRVGEITSRNFAAFSSLHNFPSGRIRGNQWGDAVTIFRTTSGAPYYFNFHKGEEGLAGRKMRLDPNHKDLANTVVIGKSGTGKTVLEMFLLAQMQKFHRPDQGKTLTCVLFDKDLGASIGVRAMGGRYYPLRNGVPSGFNPFHLEPTPNNLTFLEGLVAHLVKHDSFPITPRQEAEIHQAIRGVMSASMSKRRLSSVLEFFDPTTENGLHSRLQKWCRGGALGWLFDNATDTLKVDDCTMLGFDVTEFLDNDMTRTPTIMYLFHRIESLIDGRRIPIFLDEFWKLLNDPAFEDLVQNKLVTIRKQDGFLIMFTQSPKQVLQSPIAYAIIGQTATKIFLPNPEASYEDYVNGFKLTVREYEIVKSLAEKSRKFLIKQGSNSVVAELNLRGFDDEMAVLSGNTSTSNLVERLVQELGESPDVWLPEFQRLRNA